ncbi:non-ribosomal peptide synthetase, partial [Mycobacterium simulans]|uniref:non-ribosomal peptide synthetase n=1 Tax=Mycobacterium simulans TaxID=627089 RepID=UPI00174E7257
MKLDERTFPLTREQLDIWLAQETGRVGTEWQLGLFVKFQGTVQVDLLKWAIRRAVREAEPLRASFSEVNGQVFQRVVDYPNIKISHSDIRDSDNPVREAYRLASLIQYNPMPLAGPLFKFASFQTRADEFYLFACCHHMVIDGFGILLLGQRIATVYSAIVSGTPIPPAFFGSLNDLLVCESEYAASDDYLEDQEYWTRNLPAENEPDYRLPQATGARDLYSPSVQIQLDPAVVGRAYDMANALDMPLTSVITAACALLVRGWCGGGSEVVLDFPVSRRVRPESKTLPAMISGVVPLVLRLSPQSAVADLCEHVDTRIREALQHQRFPVRALENSAHRRDSRQRSNRVVVNFRTSIFSLDLVGASASAAFTASGLVDQFGLWFLSAGKQLFLSTAGTGQSLPDSDVVDLAKQLERVLVVMTTDPTRALSAVDVLDDDERACLDRWGNRAVLTGHGPVVASIPQLFTAQVACCPDAVALTWMEMSLTYRQLDTAANQLAHLLIHHGVAPGDVVALLLQRSADAVIAILAVLKAGAAYLPIDPAYPDARIAFMVEDAAPVVALTTTNLTNRLAGHDLVLVDVNAPAVAAQPHTAPPHPDPENLAYIVYTSGTTGTPKGVGITHRNITQLFESLDAGLTPTPTQVWTQYHSYAFDFSVWEIWGPLLHGGRLVVVPHAVVGSPQDLHALLITEQVTVLSQTPSAFYALQTADAMQPELAQQLQLQAVVFGGEALEPQRLRAWLDSHPDAPRLINMYGTTETTVHASFREIVTGDLEGAVSPIGVPLPNQAFFVLDGWLRPVPVGVVGELYVAGAG